MRKNGLAAINLAEDDELIEVKYTDGDRDVFIATKKGQCIRFHERDVRPMGRTAAGVRGIRLRDGDAVIGMQIDTQGEYMLVVAEKGLGKLTPMEGFPVQRRGGMGIKCHNVTPKTGELMGIKAVNLQDSVMMITTEGIMIRFPCSSISIQGRITSGVRLMNLAENVTVAGVAKVAIPDDEEETEDPDGTEQPENAGEETPEDGAEERQENIVDEDVPEEENDL